MGELCGVAGWGGVRVSPCDVPQQKLAGYQSQPCITMYSVSKQYEEM